MPRRKRSNENGYYHLINRGVEKRKVFLDSADHVTFLKLIDELKPVNNFNIHAYCLMDNHYHLLMEIKIKNLSTIMQQLNYSYANYFNKKYTRVGHLWQGRFKSWTINDEYYFHTVKRYIEQNPVRAGIVKDVGIFPWASCNTKSKLLSQKDLDELDIFHRTRKKEKRGQAPT